MDVRGFKVTVTIIPRLTERNEEGHYKIKNPTKGITCFDMAGYAVKSESDYKWISCPSYGWFVDPVNLLKTLENIELDKVRDINIESSEAWM